MKKVLLFALALVLGIAIGVGAIRLLDSKKTAIPSSLFDLGIQSNTGTTASPENITKNWKLLSIAYTAVVCLRQNEYSSLSAIVHPEYGLVFSPSPTLNLTSNKCFTADEIAAFDKDKTDYVWGVTDSSGEPIEMTPSEYFSRYVYEQDYANAGIIGLNQTVRTSNSLENIAEVFPDAEFVDFYMPGVTKNGVDTSWSILRLVFEEYEGALRLTAIIHSEYTA